LRCAADLQGVPEWTCGRFELSAMIEVPSRDRPRHAQPRDIARERDLAPIAPRTRAEVDDVIGDLDDLGLVLHDENRVALVAQTPKQSVHPLDVMRMQTGCGFVEDVGDVGQTRAHVPDHLGSLRLAARQRPGCSVQRQVAQTDLHKRVDRLQQPLDERCDLGIIDRSQPLAEIRDLHGRGVGDADSGDLRGTCCLVQARAMTLGTGRKSDRAVDEGSDVGLKGIAVLLQKALGYAGNEPLVGHVDALHLDLRGLLVQEVGELALRIVANLLVGIEEA